MEDKKADMTCDFSPKSVPSELIFKMHTSSSCMFLEGMLDLGYVVLLALHSPKGTYTHLFLDLLQA